MAKTPEEQFGTSLPEEPTPQITLAEPEAAQPEPPAWLEAIPEKFRSSDDPEQAVKSLANSYVELETKRNQDAQEKNSLAERLAALEAEREQYQQFDPAQWGYDPMGDPNYLSQQFEEDPVETTRAILRQELTAMQQQNAAQLRDMQQAQAPTLQARDETQSEIMGEIVAQRMASTYPDWEDFRPKAQEILMQRQIPPEQLQHLPSFQRHVDEAYRLAKYEALTEREQQLHAAGFDQAEIDRQMKLAAQTMTGRSARVEEPTPQQQKAAELIAAHKGSQHYGSWANQNIG